MQHAQGDKGEKRRRYGTVPIPGSVRHAWERAHNLSQTKNLEAYDMVETTPKTTTYTYTGSIRWYI